MSEVNGLTNVASARSTGVLNAVPDGWSEVKSGNIFDFNNGKAFYSDGYSEDGYRVIDLLNIELSGKFQLTNKDKFVSEDVYRKYPKAHLRESDLIIIMTDITPSLGLIGKTAIIDKSDTYVLNQRVGCLRPVDSNVSISFMNYMFNSDVIRLQVVENTLGTAQFYVNTPVLKNLDIPLPPLPEQKKIAAILSSVDDVIEKTQAQINKLKDLKTGMMQELLSPREGTGQPQGVGENGKGHTEFKDSPIGRIPVGWDVKCLKRMTTQIRDGNYGAEYPKASEMLESGVPFLTSTVVGNDQKVNKSKLKYISEQKHTLLAKAHIKTNDVLFTNRGANVGNVAIVPNSLDDANIGPQLTFLRVDESVTLATYLYIALQTDRFKEQLRQLDSGSAMNFFGIGTTEKFLFAVPSLVEQENIAAAVYSVIDKIDRLNYKIRQTKLFKKALMQDLLTGTVRVNVD